MIKKYILLIIINIISFILYKIAYNFTNIKESHQKWEDFYEKYKLSPFEYIDNYLPFSKDYLFSKISGFGEKLSFFIYNSALSINDFEEDESDEIELFINNNGKENENKTNLLLSESSLNFEDFFVYAIDEINIIDNGVIFENKINIKEILEEGMNKNKIIVLFIFFVQQLNIFQNLKQNIDLNRIYLLGRNRTNIQRLEDIYEMLFNYEDIQEILLLSNQFIDYHKDYGFFKIEKLSSEKTAKISKKERKMINLVLNLKNKNLDEYKNLNDFELASFLEIFEKTVKSLNYLGMAEFSYKKGLTYYKRDSNTIKLGFLALTIFINIFILIHYEDEDNKKNKRKKYKYN